MFARRISHYEVLSKLGAGGMGEVYKARDTRLNRVVALKLLPPDKMADPDRRARFVQEAQAASALNHPNIVTIYGVDRDADVDFIAMEYVQGRTLDQVIGQRGLKLGEVLKFAIQIADALTAAHAAHIVHRDLKPGNVMVTENGRVKVLDFGIAKLTADSDSEEDSTGTTRLAVETLLKGAIIGTVSYMSPEQAEGKRVDARSDIFSFGSLLYEMATGQRAFQGGSSVSTISALLRDEPKPASVARGEALPHDLEKIITRCMRKDVTRRFQHIDDVKLALEDLKEEFDSGLLFSGPLASGNARRWLPGLAAVCLFALALMAAYLLRQGADETGVGAGLKLRQLTQDSGLTSTPSLSPDGKLVAYASDRAGDAGLDIWVHQLSRGAQPIRLTKDPADESSPSFSPEGGQLTYVSEGEGGGIHIIPSLGGEERLLMRGQLENPRFSPDGKWVAASTHPHFTSKVFMVSADGGTPHSVSDGFYNADFLAWSPDGQKILVIANRRMQDPRDWWVIPLDGGPAIATGATSVLQNFPKAGAHPGRQDSKGKPNAFEWLGNYVLYSDGNLWRIRLSTRTGKIGGKPERLTSGTDTELFARAISLGSGKAAAWRVVMANIQTSEDLWSLPIDLSAAKTAGPAQRLFKDPSTYRTMPTLSADGMKLAYIAGGLESYTLRARDMASGAETVLRQQSTEMRAKISPDAKMVAYNQLLNVEAETNIYLIPASGGESRTLCNTCGLIYDWTPDGNRVIFRSGTPTKFSTVDVKTGEQHVIVSHPRYAIQCAEFSPDGLWLAFAFASSAQAPRGVYIAPMRGGQAAGENEWIGVTDRPGGQTRPWWSPDSNVIYFLSSASGKAEIWAQRLQRESKRPLDQPFRIYSPPGNRYDIFSGTWFGPGISRRQLVFPVREETGNIWISE